MSVDQQQFCEIFKKFYDLEELPTSFQLNQGRGAGSLGRARLRALLRKNGIVNTNLHQAQTFGELIQLVAGEKSSLETAAVAWAAPEKLNKAASQTSFNHVGVDIELISKFPIVDDYWVDQFYLDNFSSAEIAYCVKQVRPTEHFAGKWCAKEALVKAFPALVGVVFSEIEVLPKENLQLNAYHKREGRDSLLPAELSISHSGDYAIAVVSTNEQEVVSSGSLQNNVIESVGKKHASSLKKLKVLVVVSIVLAVASLALYCF